MNEKKRGGTRINYIYSCPKKYQKYLRRNAGPLYVEYSEEYDLSNVPIGILAIPFVANMLTLAMMLDVAIEVPELDCQFAESVQEIEHVYRKMYPYSRMKFVVNVARKVDCAYIPSELKSLFFTGGLDATSALAQTVSQKPLLINIWGGDISTGDKKSHAHLEQYLRRLTGDIGNSYTFIKSNCREMYNEEKVTKLWGTKISPLKNHGWWANIAHILAMASLVAPIAYTEKIGVHYVGSSYDSKSSVFDANNDDLLSAMRFSSLKFESVDADKNRIQKARTIIDYYDTTGIPIELKVCWYRKAGENCSQCEKCYRTIMNIVVNDGDPNKFGFVVNEGVYKEMKDFLENNYVNIGFWREIQQEFQNQQEKWVRKSEISWILDFKFNRPKAILHKLKSVASRLIH